jgi:hypothetical protein
MLTQRNPSFATKNLNLNIFDDSLTFEKFNLDIYCLDSYSIMQALDKGFNYNNILVPNFDSELNELLQKLNFKNSPYNGCGASQ